MTTFDKHEEAFEQQFAHDEELRFKATARRNKMIGLWAAEKLGLIGAEADSYALSIVMTALDQGGEPGVLAKIRKDFEAKGVGKSKLLFDNDIPEGRFYSRQVGAKQM